MSIVVVGLSHHTAPVEVRELVSLPREAAGALLKRLADHPSVSECALLSTCNRFEAYLVCPTASDGHRAVLGALADLGDLDVAAIEPHMVVSEEASAVRHLFEVAAGLDSMVMGEPQVAGQVKDAGASAIEAGTSRAVLNRLFRAATEASKRARTETQIQAGAVSVGFAAVELARKIFGELEDRSVLVLGAGEMGELTAVHLADCGVRSLTVASRTFERAEVLAARVGGQALPWGQAMSRLAEADIVVSSTGAPGYVVHRPTVAEAMQGRRNHQMFLIDIAVPRDIDPEVGDLYNVLLYDIDDLQSAIGANMEKRREEAEKARRIVACEVEGFQSWLRGLKVVPAIVALRQHFTNAVADELSRAKMGGLTDAQREQVADLLRRYSNRLLHGPVTRLKAAAEEADGLAYVDALASLFGLDLAEHRVPDEPGEGTPAKDRATA